MESALLLGFVAHEEAEARGVEAIFRFQAGALVIDGAITHPVVLGHAFDEDGLSCGGWFVFEKEFLAEQIVMELAFVVEDSEDTYCEAVLPAV